MLFFFFFAKAFCDLPAFLCKARDQVSEYEEMECMTRCAAASVFGSQIFNVAHAYEPPGGPAPASGMPQTGMRTSRSCFDRDALIVNPPTISFGKPIWLRTKIPVLTWRDAAVRLRRSIWRRIERVFRPTVSGRKHREMFEQSSKFKGNCSLLKSTSLNGSLLPRPSIPASHYSLLR